MELVEGILGAPYDPLLASSPLDAGPDLEARRDRVRGMLYGAALGDALGAPHEFRNQVPLARYTGSLEHSVTLVRRFQGGRLIGNVAQCTDDTEMTIALADSIIAGAGAYRAEAAAKQYIAWANSSTPFLGNNTRALFHGIKTYRGYENRWEGAHSVPEESWSQSNGCLMRCSPLAVLQSADWRAGAELDCRLTNPHPVCIDSVRSYICAMRALLAGATPEQATAAALAAATQGVVSAAITEGRDRKPRVLDDSKKGWVLNALYAAFFAVNLPRTDFQGRIDGVIALGGDTDTNGAIAGALLGAAHGERAMRAESRTGSNLEKMVAVDCAAGGLARPPQYSAARIPALAAQLADLATRPGW